MSSDRAAPCRICGSPRTVAVGAVEYLAGLPYAVRDCLECGCRYTQHDPAIHQRLHQSAAVSYYAHYVALAEQARRCFEAGDRAGLTGLLRTSPKYRFVLDEVAREPASARLLEVGCSRGYLTSCFILEGRNILGVDVSPAAVDAARDAFGDHFAVRDSPRAAQGQPYDLIYHLGLIGCVSDPVRLTSSLLGMLRPGGRLVFNAPNRSALRLRGQLWFDSAPPPDVVTLFPPGFWARQFGAVARVREVADLVSPDEALSIRLRQWLFRRWHPPVPKPMSAVGSTWQQPVGRAWALFEAAASKAARLTGLTVLVPRVPAEYGLFVEITTAS